MEGFSLWFILTNIERKEEGKEMEEKGSEGK
jgi:hypothetical protein